MRDTSEHVSCTLYQFTMYLLHSVSESLPNYHVPFPGTIYRGDTLCVEGESSGLGTPDRFLSPPSVSSPTLLPLTNTDAHCGCPSTLIPLDSMLKSLSGRTLGGEIWNWQIASTPFIFCTKEAHFRTFRRHFVHEKKRICLLQPFIQRQGRAIQRVPHSGISLHSRKIPPFDFDDIRPDTV